MSYIESPCIEKVWLLFQGVEFWTFPYLLTYETPMAADLLLFRMKKQEV